MFTLCILNLVVVVVVILAVFCLCHLTSSGEVAGSCDIPEQLLFREVDQPRVRTGGCLCKRSVEAESSAQLQKYHFQVFAWA